MAAMSYPQLTILQSSVSTSAGTTTTVVCTVTLHVIYQDGDDQFVRDGGSFVVHCQLLAHGPRLRRLYKYDSIRVRARPGRVAAAGVTFTANVEPSVINAHKVGRDKIEADVWLQDSNGRDLDHHVSAVVKVRA